LRDFDDKACAYPSGLAGPSGNPASRCNLKWHWWSVVSDDQTNFGARMAIASKRLHAPSHDRMIEAQAASDRLDRAQIMARTAGRDCSWIN